MNKQFKMKGASAAILFAATMFANHANATYCGPSTPTNYGGCDGTGVDFVKVEFNKVRNLELQLDLKLSYNSIDNSVSFTFRNTGSSSSSIVGIYFDDVDSNSLFSSRTTSTSTQAAFRVSSGSGVSFAMDTVAQTLPDVAPTYHFVPNYSADSISGSFTSTDYNNGVNNGGSNGDFVTLKGLLKSGNNLQSVVNAINNGTFQVGLNVATYNSQKCAYDFTSYLSEVCAPPAAVPVPSAVWLFGSALVGFIGVANRRKV